MVRKELKKLSRRELLDIIYQLKKNEELLQEELASLQEALQDKRIHLSTAGSIAEAAISITNVFSSAQAAADLYLQEVTCMKQDVEVECAKLINDAKQQAAEIIAESEKQRTLLNNLYQREPEKWYKLHQEVQLLEKATDR